MVRQEYQASWGLPQQNYGFIWTLRGIVSLPQVKLNKLSVLFSNSVLGQIATARLIDPREQAT